MSRSSCFLSSSLTITWYLLNRLSGQSFSVLRTVFPCSIPSVTCQESTKAPFPIIWAVNASGAGVNNSQFPSKRFFAFSLLKIILASGRENISSGFCSDFGDGSKMMNHSHTFPSIRPSSLIKSSPGQA